jgi:hypothetical protein
VVVPKPVPLTVTQLAITGGNELKVTGTTGNDQITLSDNNGTYTLGNTNGWTKTYTGTFVEVLINAGAGNDKVSVDASVTTPCDILGDAGNDTLLGGSGNDIINGGVGNNNLVGNAGDDTLISVGSTLDTLVGGAGNDSFWTDNNVKQTTDADSTEIAKGAVHRVASYRNGASKAVSVKLADPKSTLTTYKYYAFSNRPLFGANGPTADDIAQGQVGDCYFLSTLASIAKTDAKTIENSICDMGDGTYSVEFHVKGVAVYERVDNDLATYSWSHTTPAYANLGAGSSMWVAIFEKAFADFRQTKNTYASINAGMMSEVYTDFGDTSATITPSGAADANTYAQQIEALLDSGKSVTAAVYNVPAGANLIGSHAYTITGVTQNNDGSYSVTVRNPWGVDGNTSTDGNNDGYVTLTAAQAFAGLAVVQSATV